MGGGGAAGRNRLREHFRENWPKPRPGHKAERNHWAPKEHHKLAAKVVREFGKRERQTTELIERTFHRFIHGMGRELKRAYNAQVGRWLRKAERHFGRVAIKEFAKFLAKKRRIYLEIYRIFQQFDK